MSPVAPAATDDQAPTEEVAEGGEIQTPSSGLASDSADALLPPQMQRNFVRLFSSSAARTHDAYVVGRNAYVIIPPDLKIALDVVRAKRRAGVDERRAFLRNPRVAIADALEFQRPRGRAAVH